MQYQPMPKKKYIYNLILVDNQPVWFQDIVHPYFESTTFV